MKRIRAIIMAALTLAFLPASAQARDWPDAGGWSIVEGDDNCLMYLEYEGPGESTLIVSRYENGRNFVADVNADWSAEKGKAYEDVAFALNGEVYSGGKAMGIELLGKKGFIVSSGDDLVRDFAAAKSLHIFKGDTRIDRLNLSGSTAALAMLDRCLVSVRSQVAARKATEAAEARKEARYRDLPTDPFKN